MTRYWLKSSALTRSMAAALLREVQQDGCEAELQILLRQLSRAFNLETARLAPLPIEDAIDKS